MFNMGKTSNRETINNYLSSVKAKEVVTYLKFKEKTIVEILKLEKDKINKI